MGLALGTGAHMQELRRVQSGDFPENCAVTLQYLKDACDEARKGNPIELERIIFPVETVSLSIPKIVIRDTAVDALCHGASLAGVGIIKMDEFTKGQRVAVLTLKKELVCLGEALVSSEGFRPGNTGLVAAPRTVFMKPGTYAKCWTPQHSKKRDTIKKTAGQS
jgi:tRNA pseudouridine55 synthase/H/ACA ribonucleoprotein complex subunit 4